MNNNVNRRTFDNIFRVCGGYYSVERAFENVKLIENGFYISYSRQHHNYNKSHFEHCLDKLGFVFVNLSKTSAVYGEHRFYIAPEYFESVKNLFDLALSPIDENVELAFYVFQNIKSFAAQTQIDL